MCVKLSKCEKYTSLTIPNLTINELISISVPFSQKKQCFAESKYRFVINTAVQANVVSFSVFTPMAP